MYLPYAYSLAVFKNPEINPQWVIFSLHLAALGVGLSQCKAIGILQALGRKRYSVCAGSCVECVKVGGGVAFF